MLLFNYVSNKYWLRVYYVPFTFLDGKQDEQGPFPRGPYMLVDERPKKKKRKENRDNEDNDRAIMEISRGCSRGHRDRAEKASLRK